VRYLLILLLIASCTPQKRLARILSNHPYLIEQRDSIVSYDTLFRPIFKHDTIFMPIKGQRDTFVIRTERGVTNVYLNEDKSEVGVLQEIKPDTIIQIRTIVKELVDTSDAKINRYIIKGFVSLLIILAFILGLKRLLN